MFEHSVSTAAKIQNMHLMRFTASCCSVPTRTHSRTASQCGRCPNQLLRILYQCHSDLVSERPLPDFRKCQNRQIYSTIFHAAWYCKHKFGAIVDKLGFSWIF